MKEDEKRRVLIVYAGGTIGMVPKGEGGSLTPGSYAELEACVPQQLERLRALDIEVEDESIDNPVDSSDVSINQWVEIATIIKNNYAKYDGFVVLHGTDTMASTTTALSFMLGKLAKPVVVTGSQIPIAEPRTDAVQNLVTAIQIAARRSGRRELPVIPEVCLFFRDELLRGCRVTKASASSYHGFKSPNYPTLATAGEYINIKDTNIRNAAADDEFEPNLKVSPGVVIARLSAGLTAPVLKAILEQDEVKGLVLEAYGAGNVPSDSEFVDAIGEATKKGKHVVIVSQCLEGEVELGLYESSIGLLNQKVINGLDMTSEAAAIKLQVLLAKHLTKVDRIHCEMQVDMAGEQSKSIHLALFNETKPTSDLRIPIDEEKQVYGTFHRQHLHSAHLRFFNTSIAPGDEAAVLRIFSGLHETEPADAQGIAGEIPLPAAGGEGETLTLNVDKLVKSEIIKPGQWVDFTIFNPTGRIIGWDRAALSIVCNVANS